MELYWLLRLPYFHNIFECIGFLSIILGFFSIILFVLGNMPDPKTRYDMDCTVCKPYKRLFAYFLCLSFIAFCISAFIPTKTDLALMMGWDALNSNSVQEIIEILKSNL